MTDVERVLWAALRNRQLGGFKFRRQATIDIYVVDFLCVECDLIVELDGGQHSIETDQRRTFALEAKGYRIVRFWNHEVIESPEAILTTILAFLEEKRPSPNPLP
jgi:adenine-specific DNA-methyltransferase